MNGPRPNILHIFTDMQRADTIGALGNPVIKTPNLDRLCEEGVAFTNAFTPSPVCIAARCSMIYGQYPHHTGCYANMPMPADGRQSFMDGLTRAGYHTHAIGKCHFAPDKYGLRGFRSREVQEEGGALMEELERNHYLKYLYDNGYRHICEAYGVRGEMYYIPQPSQLPAEMHPTQWIGDRSTAFIQRRASSDEPWYLFSSFIHPHPPLNPPNPWHKLYRPTLMPLPKVPPDSDALLTFVNRVQNRYKYRDQGTDNNLVRCIKAYYYACISFVDYQIGRILDALERTGKAENTLIVFTSDHGEYLGDYGCFGKRSMHDASARVPLIARQDGRFEGGVICDTPVSLVDLASTFLSAAGAAITSHAFDGVDLAEVAAGSCEREMVFGQHYDRGFEGMTRPRRNTWTEPSDGTPDSSALERASMSTYMAVSKEWKYFYSAADDKEFLFDRVRDPLESRNRKGVLFCQDARRHMRGALISHLIQGGEAAGIAGNTWKSFPPCEIDDDPDSGLLIQDNYTPWAEMAIPGYNGRAEHSS